MCGECRMGVQLSGHEQGAAGSPWVGGHGLDAPEHGLLFCGAETRNSTLWSRRRGLKCKAVGWGKLMVQKLPLAPAHPQNGTESDMWHQLS